MKVPRYAEMANKQVIQYEELQHNESVYIYPYIPDLLELSILHSYSLCIYYGTL